MRVQLFDINQQEYRLDTPDPALVGPWMKVLFDDIMPKRSGRPWPAPIEMRIVIS